MTQLLIVKVGNDDIPAIDKDIRGITEKMGKMLGAESIVIAFPHNTTFETLDIQPDELLVVKVGNDNHLASDEDLENMQDDIEEAFRIPGPRYCIVTHHAVEFQTVKRNLDAITKLNNAA